MARRIGQTGISENPDVGTHRLRNLKLHVGRHFYAESALFHSEGGSHGFLQNASTSLPNYTASHPRRSYSLNNCFHNTYDVYFSVTAK
jgi:hypothetical protein